MRLHFFKNTFSAKGCFIKYNYSSNFSMQIYIVYVLFFFGICVRANALWLMNILFANIFLGCRVFAFVVISVYCFLYIFLPERTKSYSNASQPKQYLACAPATSTRTTSQLQFCLARHLFALCLYFVPC